VKVLYTPDFFFLEWWISLQRYALTGEAI